MKDLNTKGCVNLANAVLMQAVLEYKEAVLFDDKPTMESLELFFKGEWAALLAGGPIRNVPVYLRPKCKKFKQLALDVCQDNSMRRGEVFTCPVCDGQVRMWTRVSPYSGKTVSTIRCSTCKMGFQVLRPVTNPATLVRTEYRSMKEVKDNGSEY